MERESIILLGLLGRLVETFCRRVEVIEFCNERRVEKDQATKGSRRMPWHMAPKKDVVSCEKLRGGANILISVDIRMRELSTSNVVLPYPEHIGIEEGTRGTETS